MNIRAGLRPATFNIWWEWSLEGVDPRGSGGADGERGWGNRRNACTLSRCGRLI